MKHRPFALAIEIAFAFLTLTAGGFATDAILTDDSFGANSVANGNSAALKIGAASNAYLHFSLGSLPTGTLASHVQGAVLRLYVNTFHAGGNLTVFTANGGWSEGEKNPPSPAIQQNQSGLISKTKSFVTIDLTETVKQWIDDPTTNFGLVLQSSGGLNVWLDSKENTATGHVPTLDITLGTPSIAVHAVLAANTAIASLSGVTVGGSGTAGWTVIFDTTAATNSTPAFSPSTGQFTAPIAGKYWVGGGLYFDNAHTWNAGEYPSLSVLPRRGATTLPNFSLAIHIVEGPVAPLFITGGTTVDMEAGDTIELTVFVDSSAKVIVANSTYIDVYRISD